MFLLVLLSEIFVRIRTWITLRMAWNVEISTRTLNGNRLIIPRTTLESICFLLFSNIYLFIYFVLSNGSVNRRDYVISAYISMDVKVHKECLWKEAVSGFFQCTHLESVCTVWGTPWETLNRAPPSINSGAFLPEPNCSAQQKLHNCTSWHIYLH